MGNITCSSSKNKRSTRQRGYTNKCMKNWNVHDVKQWLLNINDGELIFIVAIFQKHKINGIKLISLDDNQLNKMGVGMVYQEKIKCYRNNRLKLETQDNEDISKSTQIIGRLNAKQMSLISTLNANENNKQNRNNTNISVPLNSTETYQKNTLLQVEPSHLKQIWNAEQITHEFNRFVVDQDFELADIAEDLDDPHSIIIEQIQTKLNPKWNDKKRNDIHQSLQKYVQKSKENNKPRESESENSATDDNDIINDNTLLNADILFEMSEIVANYPLYNQYTHNSNYNSSNYANSNQNNEDNSNSQNNNNNNGNESNGNGNGNGNGNSGDKNRDNNDDDKDKDKKGKKPKDHTNETKEEKEEKDEKKDEEQKLNVDAAEFIPYNIHKNKILSKLIAIDEEHPLRNQPKKSKKLLDYSYDASPLLRASGNIKIARKFTNKNGKIETMIKENITGLYFYMDKSTAMQTNKQIKLQNGKIVKIINYDFHHKYTNENLYCVVENVENDNNVMWEMKDELLTAKQIEEMYKISAENIPQSTRMSTEFKQLNEKEMIINIMMNKQKMKDIINETKWNKVPIKNRVNNRKRLTLSLNKREFIKHLNVLNDFDNTDNIHLIPIVMFNNLNNKYWIEYVWIARIDSGTNIGISFKYNNKTNDISVSGIHLDKTYVINQHQLVSPGNDVDYLDDIFKSNITDLAIGNPDDYKNAINALKQALKYRNKIFEQKELKLKLKCDTLNEQNIDLKKEIEKLHSMPSTPVRNVICDSYDNSSKMQHNGYLKYNLPFSVVNNTIHPSNTYK